MHPIVVRVGPFTLYSYGVLLVAGFLVSTWWASRAAREARRSRGVLTPEQVVDLACFVLLGGIVGGRLFYALLHWQEFVSSPLELVAIWHGGLVFYGGLAGGLATACWFAARHRIDALRAFDQMTPFAVLGHAFGRVGCFLNGCCYGKPTAWWCGVRFPGHDAPVFPTQLFEAGGLVLLSLGLRWWQRRGGLASRGAIFGGYLLGYGLLRFGIELLRGDQAPACFGLTLQQVISLVAAIAGTVLVFPLSQRPENKNRPRHAHLPVPRRHR